MQDNLKVHLPVAEELILFQLESKAKTSHWLQQEPAGLKDSHDITNEDNLFFINSDRTWSLSTI